LKSRTGGISDAFPEKRKGPGISSEGPSPTGYPQSICFDLRNNGIGLSNVLLEISVYNDDVAGSPETVLLISPFSPDHFPFGAPPLLPAENRPMPVTSLQSFTDFLRDQLAPDPLLRRSLSPIFTDGITNEGNIYSQPVTHLFSRSVKIY
jgi:hypothetical protein